MSARVGMIVTAVFKLNATLITETVSSMLERGESRLQLTGQPKLIQNWMTPVTLQICSFATLFRSQRT